ncbi:hypothetical protein AOQ84DRAFT_392212 [Glonium stellatum]|uniref:Uncharacterized protein n=1 Tax=Glonium stellatum TaxID=574774 RepID=A0A8E2JND7_9PEZI|nr:hypothetical protein AOQ84DRAFT_392212 [Glonium stellatum]
MSVPIPHCAFKDARALKISIYEYVRRWESGEKLPEESEKMREQYMREDAATDLSEVMGKKVVIRFQRPPQISRLQLNSPASDYSVPLFPYEALQRPSFNFKKDIKRARELILTYSEYLDPWLATLAQLQQREKEIQDRNFTKSQHGLGGIHASTTALYMEARLGLDRFSMMQESRILDFHQKRRDIYYAGVAAYRRRYWDIEMDTQMRHLRTSIRANILSLNTENKSKAQQHGAVGLETTQNSYQTCPMDDQKAQRPMRPFCKGIPGLENASWKYSDRAYRMYIAHEDFTQLPKEEIDDLKEKLLAQGTADCQKLRDYLETSLYTHFNF